VNNSEVEAQVKFDRLTAKSAHAGRHWWATAETPLQSSTSSRNPFSP